MEKNPIRQPGKVAAIIDGQFGSTGKGLIAAYLGLRYTWGTATTNASANAGHTAIVGTDKFVTYHMPMVSVVDPECESYLNAGAIIDPKLFLQEIKTLKVNPKKIKIHPRAAIIQDAHKAAEMDLGSSQSRSGSTRKGVGAALAAKVIRQATLAGEIEELKPFIGKIDLMERLDRSASVMMEIPQGASLSLNSGLAYPFCTSREVSVAQALSDAAIHPHYLGQVIMAVRSMPIRVGHVMDGDKVAGHSGPCYSDQRELTWEELGQKPEITTVTGRVRRVFTWSDKQYQEAIKINRPTAVFYNFLNYHKSRHDADRALNRVESFGVPIRWYGTGPTITDIYTDREEAYRALGW